MYIIRMDAEGYSHRTGRIGVAVSLALVCVLASSAAIACFSYVGNGMAVGALIGLPGRSSDVAAAQKSATNALRAFWICQIGLAIVVFSLLRFGYDASPLARILARGMVAAFLSVQTTLIAVAALWVLMAMTRYLGFSFR